MQRNFRVKQFMTDLLLPCNGSPRVGCESVVPMTPKTSGHQIMKPESLFAWIPLDLLASED
jgi:hypothetical protein